MVECKPSNENLSLASESHTKFIPSLNHTCQLAVSQRFVSSFMDKGDYQSQNVKLGDVKLTYSTSSINRSGD